MARTHPLPKVLYMRKWREKNHDKISEYNRKWREKNIEKAIARNKDWRQRNPEKQKKSEKNWRLKNPNYYQEWNRKNRKKVYEHYENCCACCGETTFEFLTIDHINGDGASHRKKIGQRIAYWLIKNNYPEGFQILCGSCHHAKSFYGGCPHNQKVFEIKGTEILFPSLSVN